MSMDPTTEFFQNNPLAGKGHSNWLSGRLPAYAAQSFLGNTEFSIHNFDGSKADISTLHGYWTHLLKTNGGPTNAEMFRKIIFENAQYNTTPASSSAEIADYTFNERTWGSFDRDKAIDFSIDPFPHQTAGGVVDPDTYARANNLWASIQRVAGSRYVCIGEPSVSYGLVAEIDKPMVFRNGNYNYMTEIQHKMDSRCLIHIFPLILVDSKGSVEIIELVNVVSYFSFGADVLSGYEPYPLEPIFRWHGNWKQGNTQLPKSWSSSLSTRTLAIDYPDTSAYFQGLNPDIHEATLDLTRSSGNLGPMLWFPMSQSLESTNRWYYPGDTEYSYAHFAQYVSDNAGNCVFPVSGESTADFRSWKIPVKTHWTRGTYIQPSTLNYDMVVTNYSSFYDILLDAHRLKWWSQYLATGEARLKSRLFSFIV